MAKAVGVWPRPWRLCQGRGGVAKDLGSWPMPWGHGQGREGLPNLNPTTVEG